MNSISVACVTRTNRAPSSRVMQLTPLGALSRTSMSPTDSPSRSMLVKNGGPSGALLFRTEVPFFLCFFFFLSLTSPASLSSINSSSSSSSVWFSWR